MVWSKKEKCWPNVQIKVYQTCLVDLSPAVFASVSLTKNLWRYNILNMQIILTNSPIVLQHLTTYIQPFLGFYNPSARRLFDLGFFAPLQVAIRQRCHAAVKSQRFEPVLELRGGGEARTPPLALPPLPPLALPSHPPHPPHCPDHLPLAGVPLHRDLAH